MSRTLAWSLEHWGAAAAASWFEAAGSIWYTALRGPGDFAVKFLRTWPGLDRRGTIGFRCVVDL